MTSARDPANNLEHFLTVRCNPDELIFVGLTPNGQTLVVGEQTEIRLWNLSTRQEVCTLIHTNRDLAISSIAMSVDGQTLVCGSGRGIVKVWNLLTQQQRLTFRAHHHYITALALSHDGRIMASSAYDGTDSGTLRVWNLKKGREIGFDIESINDDLALSPDGQIVVYGKGNILKVWNWKSCKEDHLLEGHDYVKTVAISVDGQTGVSSDWDKVNVWNLATRQEIRTLVGHRDKVYSVAISADGQTLVSSDSTMLKVWELATGQEIYTLSLGISILEDEWLQELLERSTLTLEECLRLYGTRTYVAISADGRTLVCGGGDTVKVWRVL